MAFNTGQTFTFGEQPSATKWQFLWDNDYALQDWSAFDNDSFPEALIADGGLSAAKLDADAIGHGFLEIGRTTLGSAASSISVASLPAKKYLKIIMFIIPAGSNNLRLRFNNDSASNYSQQHSIDFGGAVDATSQDGFDLESGNGAWVEFNTATFVNVANQIKLGHIWAMDNVGSNAATVAPDHIVDDAKWANTSVQINRVDVVDTAAGGNIAAGSEVIVFGSN